MGEYRKDLAGRRFGKLVALELRQDPGNVRKWLCQCDCGKQTIVRQGNLRDRGGTESCGCLAFDAIARRPKRPKMQKPPEYNVWSAMIARCSNPKCNQFHNYGGRGIHVDPSWQGKGGFANFIRDLGPRPTNKHSIERKDNDGPYCPGNCVWATRGEQSRNTRRTRHLTFQGRTMPLTDWASELGMKPVTLLQRLNRSGWTVERALSTPVVKTT